ncbi:Na(+)/H(+) antiporter NhaA [Arenibacter antarcticus]|uniref:Na(+)/H(+) antiporter NhaA n=1 Tax=Arenibacter antarcticus TaxID=2040469 RepID=A0ABW5VIJ9_9FLAO|nr:Na+/H+ antiporter NhaA [Arenibacter sp. H213]MCM4166540.1 Na+/H+ antiporter NhaA [Arenibacter sp. H213]
MIKKRILTPLLNFSKIESFSGILLFTATIIAMLWANSSYGESYQALWQFHLGISSETFGFSLPLILWVNDALMVLFFFLIGLEIKRELLIGELNSLRKAALPMFAAVGGMLIPMSIFLFLNNSPETHAGWGIPMATDIAFSLAILKVLGNRVPLSLKIFLTAFAIVDDLGAVIVIALFYSTGIDWMLLFYAFVLLGVLFYLSYRNLYSRPLMILLGFVIWILFFASGIHPTIAGVLLAFTVPLRQRIDMDSFMKKLSDISKGFAQTKRDYLPVLSSEQIVKMDELEALGNKFKSPLQRSEHKLHGWVAYFIMPVFALANAGVALGTDIELDTDLLFHIAIALFLGKLIGVTLMSWIGVKLKLAILPGDITFKQIIGVAILAGVGFTMSIFIANLAFADNISYIDSAKVGIIVGSSISGVIGYIVLRLTSTVKVSKKEPKHVPVE